jgi:hypothetical protein
MTSEWVVAGAEIILACGTVFLGLQARNEARSVSQEAGQVGEQVKLEREQMEAALRPYVIPAPDSDWSWHQGLGKYAGGEWRKVLPVKNAGPGAALNVRGELNFGPPSGTYVAIIPTSLASGDREDLGVHWDASARDDWDSLTGMLDYEDVQGGRWRTDFGVNEENGVRYVHVNSVAPLPAATAS